MNFDAIVWLLVGLGLGVALSLMLLMLHASLERFRLGRRFKRARALRQVPKAEVTQPVPPAADAPAGSNTSTPPPAPKPKTAPKLSIVAANDRAAKSAPAVDIEKAPVGKVDETAPAVPPAPKPVQSVEALFAEAFAIDKLAAPAPLPQPDKDDQKT